MSMYAVDGEILNGIARAIQGKTGSDEPMTIASMASAIEGIGDSGFSIPSEFGLSKMWMGNITFDTPTLEMNIPHGLGVVPKIFFMWLNDNWDYGTAPLETNYIFALYYLNPSQTVGEDCMTAGKLINSNNVTTLKWGNTYDGKLYAYNDRIKTHSLSTTFLSGKYNIIALA